MGIPILVRRHLYIETAPLDKWVECKTTWLLISCFDLLLCNSLKKMSPRVLKKFYYYYQEFFYVAMDWFQFGVPSTPDFRIHILPNLICYDFIIFIDASGGRFKNAYELLNLRALKIPMLYTNRTFQCMSKIFCVEFQRVPLKFHTKYLTHTLKDVDFIHRWNFKSS